MLRTLALGNCWERSWRVIPVQCMCHGGKIPGGTRGEEVAAVTSQGACGQSWEALGQRELMMMVIIVYYKVRKMLEAWSPLGVCEAVMGSSPAVWLVWQRHRGQGVERCWLEPRL